MSTMSNRPKRWFRPPPQVTAYFSNRRQPGVVLRVSRICARVPLTASTNWAVSVAMPQSRWRKFSATRSALEQGAGRAGDLQERLARRHALAVLRGAGDLHGGRELAKGGFGQGQAGDHQRFARPHERALARAVSGTVASVVTSPLPMSSARASATARRISSADNGSTPPRCTKSQAKQKSRCSGHGANKTFDEMASVASQYQLMRARFRWSRTWLALAIWAALTLSLLGPNCRGEEAVARGAMGKGDPRFRGRRQDQSAAPGCDPVHRQLQHPALDEPRAGFPGAQSHQPRLRRVATVGFRRIRGPHRHPYKPKLVLLYAGDNDIAAGKIPGAVLG